jgi:DNA-binding MarR family transcriptional regulator
MSKKKRRSKGPQFVQMFHHVMDTAAWKDLSPGAKSAYVALKRWYNGSNNGRVGFGSRGAGEALGMSKSSAARYLAELETHGFIVRMKDSSFNQKRLTIEWLLTEHRNDTNGDLPLRTFTKWTGTEKKEPVPSVKRAVPSAGQPETIPEESIAHSPMRGTAEAKLIEAQSHGRDTSTSVPGGRYVLNEAAKPQLVAAVRRAIELSNFNVTNSISQTPLADLVADELIRRSESDCLSRTVLKTFPGAKAVISVGEIQKYLGTRQV